MYVINSIIGITLLSNIRESSMLLEKIKKKRILIIKLKVNKISSKKEYLKVLFFLQHINDKYSNNNFKIDINTIIVIS